MGPPREQDKGTPRCDPGKSWGNMPRRRDPADVAPKAVPLLVLLEYDAGLRMDLWSPWVASSHGLRNLLFLSTAPA